MKRTLIALCASISAALIPLNAYADRAPVPQAEQSATLAAASAALNAQRLIQGRFRQTGPDGSVSTGRFFLQRPGRVRFEYDPPAPLLIVADGSVLAVQDRQLRNTNRAPLRSTPLYFVLKDNLNLARDAHVTRVERDGDLLFVTVRDRSGQADGDLTLALAGPEYTLRSWDVVDATGGRTRFAITASTTPDTINPAAFRAPPATAVSPRSQGR
ncbi:MAG: outer membrane lipoprotein carrier protein LolA [Hyphomonadaceae bacterium]|nr:outer membrane lipoprotein carrier protein LolA [Hyphomonadaceae bacterium]